MHRGALEQREDTPGKLVNPKSLSLVNSNVPMLVSKTW